jgi:hypothetical protein
LVTGGLLDAAHDPVTALVCCRFVADGGEGETMDETDAFVEELSEAEGRKCIP